MMLIHIMVLYLNISDEKGSARKWSLKYKLSSQSWEEKGSGVYGVYMITVINIIVGSRWWSFDFALKFLS